MGLMFFRCCKEELLCRPYWLIIFDKPDDSLLANTVSALRYSIMIVRLTDGSNKKKKKNSIGSIFDLNILFFVDIMYMNNSYKKLL